jgi:predicted ATPase with chaperone activity
MAITKLAFSLADTEKAISVGLTIVQLDNARQIDAQHIAEAIQYRMKGY